MCFEPRRKLVFRLLSLTHAGHKDDTESNALVSSFVFCAWALNIDQSPKRNKSVLSALLHPLFAECSLSALGGEKKVVL